MGRRNLMSLDLLPVEVDLTALHEAFIAEGYRITGETSLTRGYAKQVKPLAGEQAVTIPLPGALEAGFDPKMHDLFVERAFNWLITTTGKPYLEIGPRNDRERAMITAINAARHAARSTTQA